MFRHISLFAAAACVVLLAGCGSNAGASTPTKVAAQIRTATPVANGLTPTSVPVAAPTATAATTPPTTPTASPTVTQVRVARSTPTPLPARATATSATVSNRPSLVFVSVHPLTVAAGGSLSISVQTVGGARRAELYLGSGAPSAPSPATYPLGQFSPGKWSGSGIAPMVGGTYHFTVGLFDASGRRYLEDNDAWNVQVQGGASPASPGATASGVKPLFADIPLAPPFSYGNPVEAVFNANGRTVNGSEVTSNTRADVPASVVAQYYTVHFPRSGWTTAGATVPQGATSFSMTATSGSRVCIVQFTSGTVHIFYG